MIPLKVTFRFGSPVMTDSEHPIHLDALIASSAVVEAEIGGETDPWAAADDLSDYLDKAVHENGWVWKASALRFETETEAMDGLFVAFNMVRRSDPARRYDDLEAGLWGSDRKINPETFSINTRSGQQRGYQWIAQARWMRSATAWAVGDIDAVREALKLERIGYVGKMRRNGFGRVVSVDVEPVEDARDADRWLLRTLPFGMPGRNGVPYAPVQACLRAPYWRKTDRVAALEPVDA